ncbi:hypothetical protein MRB53_040019 [Persea americana]|nr:hypothetical protein MRB53_040019 [Persea americana]
MLMLREEMKENAELTESAGMNLASTVTASWNRFDLSVNEAVQKRRVGDMAPADQNSLGEPGNAHLANALR